MEENIASLSDEEVFLGHMVEFLDDSLPVDLSERVNNYAASHKDAADKFQRLRGRMQLSLQSFYLSENELLELRRLARNESDRHDMDEVRIDDIERAERWSYWRRQMVFFMMIAGTVLIMRFVFSSPPQQRFDALQALAYEAVAFEEATNSRLDFPSNDLEDVRAFFAKNQQLWTNPEVYGPLGMGWHVDGATVIEYDEDMISVVQYGNSVMDEKLFHFTYPGDLALLESSEVGEINGFKYQAYASDKVNLIAWQQAEGYVSMVVGHRAADDLAKIIQSGVRQ